MKHLTYRLALIFAIMALSCANAFAQQVKGTVKDSSGQPVVGAAVVVEGTTNGVTVDLDGKFVFNTPVPKDAVLVVTSIGYKDAKIPVGGGIVDVILQEDAEMLEETVVVGYGVQKKAVVSAAISTVGNEMLEKVAAVRVDDALKGLTPGVNVTANNGQPGAGSQIRIRGIGTINDSNPLYVVDGMPMTSGIDYLSPNDIERMDILKDAASCAVYGTRGANGVILITTKKGAKDKVSVSYDFQYGISNPWRKREVLNATEYGVMINEGRINAGLTPMYADPYAFGEGTDWQNEVFNRNAPTQSHQLSISGSSRKNQYYVSASWYSQDGIVGGNYDRSNYNRFTARVNDKYSVFDATEERSWLNRMAINLNVSYSYTDIKGIDPNNTYGSTLGSAVTLSPILGVYVDPDSEQAVIDKYSVNENAGTEENPYDKPYNLLRGDNGRLFTVPGSDYNEMFNPVAELTMDGQYNRYDRIVGGADVEFQIYDGLTFKSSVGVDLGFRDIGGWTPNYYLTSVRKAGHSSVWSQMGRQFSWQVENVLTYDNTFDGHHVTAMLGQSAFSYKGKWVQGANQNLVEEDPDRANLGFTTGIPEFQTAVGGLDADYRLASIFARASYDYKDRYMIQATIRRDGSSRFGPNNRFAIFPSVSAAWNIKNEPWMQDKAPWLTALKLRASWGRNGNDSIGNFMYTVLTSQNNNYVFGSGANGTDAEQLAQGSKASGTANPDLKWETSDQTDVGIDVSFFDGSLLFTADYFYKYTDGMLMEQPVPTYIGESKPWGNVGSMTNSGVELELNYRKAFGDVFFSVGANASYIKSRLVNLGNDSGFMNLDSFSTLGTITRGENGCPYPFFYGYKTDGIFQNPAEVASYVNADGALLQPDAVPGDVRFVDVTGDGIIDDEDRTYIGKCVPDWTLGFNASLEWKGIDFSMVWQGVFGSNVFDATRRTDISMSNLPKWMLGRWTGEGTSDTLPRFTLEDTNKNWRVSDLYIKDASYFRLKNITLGYTLPAKWTKKVFVKKLRLYVAAENLLTLTKYDGFDPEISSYVDRGIYPQSRTFQFGASITF